MNKKTAYHNDKQLSN